MSNGLHEAAKDYVARGWPTFPCREKQKQPLTQHGFKDATTDAEQIAEWWGCWPAANVAIATGPSSGLLVLDIDPRNSGNETLAELEAAHGALPPTIEAQTGGGGRHLFYRHPAGGDAIRAKLGAGLDVKRDGGYIIAPPSVHPSGEPYRWRAGHDPADRQPADLPAWLADMLTVTPPTPAPAPRPTVRHDQADKLARASAYLSAMPPAVQGAGGHNALFTAARALVLGFELDETTAAALLWSEYNTRCAPPWDYGNPKDRRDFERKVSEAARQPFGKASGYLLNDGAADAGAVEHGGQIAAALMAGRNAHTTTGTAAAATAPAIDTERAPQLKLAAEDDATAAPRFVWFTAAEFDGLDLRRAYHIPGILAAGPVPTVLAGSFKTLKTSIAMDLLLSLATGARFLGHYPVNRPARVGFMSGESGGFALQNMARRVAASKGWTLAGVGDSFRIATDVPNLGDPQHMHMIEQFIADNDIELLAIDPTYLAMQGLRTDDAGSLFAVGRFLDPLGALAKRTGVTPIVIHHNSRGATRANAGEPAELADIAWSGFSEWAGQWLLLSRRERYDPDSAGEHALWLSAGGRDGHSTLAGVNVTEGRQDDPDGRRWEVEIERAGQVRAEAMTRDQERREQAKEQRREKQLQADREAVIAAIEKTPEGDTSTAIRDRAGLSGQRFAPILADLLADNKIEPCTVTKPNKREYDGYRLPPGRTGTEQDAPGQKTLSG